MRSLKSQNNGKGGGGAWLDCEARGRTHRWLLSRAQFVGADPVAAYVPCARCPVSRRQTVR